MVLPEGLMTRLKYIHYHRTFKAFPVNLISEFEIMSLLIPADSTVLDIGANIGLFSKCFSLLVGSKGKVYSLEPVPQTFSILCSNIKFLTFDNVTPLPYAASAKETTVTMVIPTYQSRHGIDVNGNLYEGKGDNFYEARIIDEKAEVQESASKRLPVETKKIDLLFSDCQNISFIKCDVEGHELPCVLGSLKILQRDQPALLIEVMDDPTQKTSPAFQLFEILKKEGYTPFIFKDKFLRPFMGDSDAINFFFLRPHHLAIVHSFLND